MKKVPTGRSSSRWKETGSIRSSIQPPFPTALRGRLWNRGKLLSLLQRLPPASVPTACSSRSRGLAEVASCPCQGDMGSPLSDELGVASDKLSGIQAELESLLPTGSLWPCCPVYVGCPTEGGLATVVLTHPLVEGA